MHPSFPTRRSSDHQAPSSDTIAIGVNSHASGSWSLALGGGSQGTAFGAIALGVSSTATGQFSTATGVYSQATRENSLALGGFLGLSTENTDLFRLPQATAALAYALGTAVPVPAQETDRRGAHTPVPAGA